MIVFHTEEELDERLVAYEKKMNNETIVAEEAMKVMDAVIKSIADIAPKILQVKCPRCGVFCKVLDKEVDGVPPGNECPTCRWHSAQKNSVVELLSNSLIELVRAAPMNPEVRAQVLAAVLIPIPDELKNYSAIEKWIKFKVPAVSRIPTVPEPTAFNVHCAASQRVYGSANYSLIESGDGPVAVNPELVLSVVRRCIENGDNVDMFFTRLDDTIRETIREDGLPFDLDGTSSYEYDDHDQSGSDSYNLDIDRGCLGELARNWLYQNRPDLLRRLEGQLEGETLS